MNNILLTGDKQIGKSTIIDTTINLLKNNLQSNVSIGGYRIKREIYTKDNITTRIFFINCLLDDSSYKIIENKVTNEQWEMNTFIEGFNNYSFNLNKSISSCDLIILDEIGFTESKADEFVKNLYSALNSFKPVLGVIRNKECSFINNIKNREDVLLISVNEENRNYLPNEILKLLECIILGQ